MKFLAVLAIFAIPLFSETPTLTPEDKLRIRDAQIKVMAASEVFKNEQIKLIQSEQYQIVSTAARKVEDEQKLLGGVIQELIKKLKIDPTKFQLTPDLKFEPVPPIIK